MISSKLRARFGFFLFFSLLAVLLVYLMRWQSETVISKTSQDQQDRDILLAQVLSLQKSYQRMVALGYEPHAITYVIPAPPKEETPADPLAADANILGRHRLGKPLTPPASLLAVAEARWQLGGGQILGDTTQKPDVAFFLAGLTLEACQTVNAILWQDNPDTEPATSTTTASHWAEFKASLEGLYPKPGRGEGCLMTSDGQYLYYRLVYDVVRG